MKSVNHRKAFRHLQNHLFLVMLNESRTGRVTKPTRVGNKWKCPVPNCKREIASDKSNPENYNLHAFNGHLRTHGGEPNARRLIEEKPVVNNGEELKSATK